MTSFDIVSASARSSLEYVGRCASSERPACAFDGTASVLSTHGLVGGPFRLPAPATPGMVPAAGALITLGGGGRPPAVAAPGRTAEGGVGLRSAQADADRTR